MAAINLIHFSLLLALFTLASSVLAADETPVWLAGDHHIHSRYSVGWDSTSEPPTAILGGDAIYPIPMNALMARHFGLSWIVTTDHGGPNHSKVNLERAYPELRQSRLVIPELIQFYGMEFDTPGADHSSLIIPRTDDEAEQLFAIESRFSKREPWPTDPTRDTEPLMLEALRAMQAQVAPPLLIANHPSRSAPDLGVYGLDTPSELRAWNDAAPEVAVGMAGAPGHQAAGLLPDGSSNLTGARGGYGNYPTMGGFDQFTARVGGFWDSMLGEGRRWWITANSDSHKHYTEGGADFWPGEFSKTYVLALRNPASIISAMRAGHIFVTTGDLISALEFTVHGSGIDKQASMGETLELARGESATVRIRFLDPEGFNHNGDSPTVSRVDLIMGEILGSATLSGSDSNPTTRVVASFDATDWIAQGPWREIQFPLGVLAKDSYLRLRGTNGDQLEPLPDPKGENPWSDLWFYANPIFIELQ